MFRSYETIFDNVPEGEEGEAKEETKGSSKVRHQSNKVIADHLRLDWMKKISSPYPIFQIATHIVLWIRCHLPLHNHCQGSIGDSDSIHSRHVHNFFRSNSVFKVGAGVEAVGGIFDKILVIFGEPIWKHFEFVILFQAWAFFKSWNQQVLDHTYYSYKWFLMNIIGMQ